MRLGCVPLTRRGRERGLERHARRRFRIEHHDAPVAIDERGRAGGGRRAERDHHGHAAGPRQHRHMRGGRAGRERDGAALAPVRREEAGRRQIVPGNDRAVGNVVLALAAGQMRQHPVADIGEVGGTGPEIVVLRRLVAIDLGLERRSPGAVGRNARLDRVKGALGQCLVLEHRHLEGEDLGGLALAARHQRRHRFGGGRDSRRGGLPPPAPGSPLAWREAAAIPTIMTTGPMARPGEAARPDRRISLIVCPTPRRIFARPAPGSRRAPPPRRRPRRENARSCPWRPSRASP